jgi:hypothetical protein
MTSIWPARSIEDLATVRQHFVEYTASIGARNGLGRRLAEAAIANARMGAYSGLRLDTLDTMTGARSLYRSLSFIEIPPYGRDHLPGTMFYGLTPSG